MESTRKILLVSAALVLLTLFFISVAGAVSIDVMCAPETMNPGESTTIRVECDRASSGSVTVITPSGVPSSATIAIPAGGSASVKYPDEFGLGASTSELGEYAVTVTLSGVESRYMASFWVFFQVVIPDFPMVGTVGAVVVMLSSLGLHVVRRRRPTQLQP